MEAAKAYGAKDYAAESVTMGMSGKSGKDMLKITVLGAKSLSSDDLKKALKGYFDKMIDSGETNLGSDLEVWMKRFALNEKLPNPNGKKIVSKI